MATKGNMWLWIGSGLEKTEGMSSFDEIRVRAVDYKIVVTNVKSSYFSDYIMYPY